MVIASLLVSRRSSAPPLASAASAASPIREAGKYGPTHDARPTCVRRRAARSEDAPIGPTGKYGSGRTCAKRRWGHAYDLCRLLAGARRVAWFWATRARRRCAAARRTERRLRGVACFSRARNLTVLCLRV